MGILQALNIAQEARKLIDGLHTSEAEKLALHLEFQKLDQALAMARIDVAKAEAEHPSWFVAGARPFMYWIAGIAVLWASFLRHIFDWIGGMVAATTGFPYTATPEVDLYEVMTALGIILFESGRRTFEKTKGVSRDRLFPAKGGE